MSELLDHEQHIIAYELALAKAVELVRKMGLDIAGGIYDPSNKDLRRWTEHWGNTETDLVVLQKRARRERMRITRLVEAGPLAKQDIWPLLSEVPP